MGQNPTYIEIGPEVGDAIAGGGAVVALESTIISHGMPYPKNLETAREVEGVIRAAGAVPATIAVMDGHFTVGLSPAELEQVALLGITTAGWPAAFAARCWITEVIEKAG